MSEINLDDYISKPGKQTVIDTSDPDFGQKWQDARASNTQKNLSIQTANEVEKQKQLLELQKEYERDQIQWQTEQANADLQPKLDSCLKQLEQEKEWSGYLNKDVEYYQSESMKIKADFEALKRVTAASFLLSLILAGILVYKTIKLKSKKLTPKKKGK